MYFIEVHPRMNQLVNTLHQCHAWQDEIEETTLFRKMAPKLFYLFFQVFFGVSLLSGGLLCDEKGESVFLIDVGIGCSVAAVKLYYILWKKKLISTFIQAIGAHSVSDYNEFTKVNNKVNNVIKFSFSMNLITIAAVVALFLFSLPVFSNERRLPFNIWFPFDWKNNTILYWIAFAMLLISSTVSLITQFFSYIVWYLMLNCAIKYQILGNQLKNMFAGKSTNKNRNVSKVAVEHSFLQDLIGAIKAHQNIKDNVDEFMTCFENIFFLQITTSAICICGSVYILAFGISETTLMQCLFYVTLMLYNIFDIFMLMFLGNEIELSSDRLSYCLFESNWLERSETCKMCIIILTEVFKQPQELVIAILYPLNLETFTSILNLAYSMFNVLQNLS